MNLFKKIFGKKEKVVSDQSDQITEKEILRKIADELIEKHAKSFAESLQNKIPKENTEPYKSKYYKIPSVIKTANEKLKSEGIQSCIDYINTILNDIDRLQKDQAISLTRNLVKILNSNNHESLNNFDAFLNTCLSKYNVQQDPMFYSSISEIYSEISPELAINYISQKNIELLNNETFKSLNYNLLIDKIKILVEIDSLELAEEEITNSNKLIENNTMFQFISDKIKALNLSYQIAINRKDFKNSFKYEILLFILETVKDLSDFPGTHNGFLYRKNLALKGEYGLKYDSSIVGFKNGNISKSDFEKIKKDVYQFAYNDLPNRIGIKAEYLEKAFTTDELINTFGKNWYMNSKMITRVPFEHYAFIESYVSNMLKIV